MIKWNLIPEYVSVFDTLKQENSGLSQGYDLDNKAYRDGRTELDLYFPFIKFDDQLVSNSKISSFVSHFMNTTESALHVIKKEHYLILNERCLNKLAYYFNYELKVSHFYFINEKDNVKKIKVKGATNLFELTDFGNIPLARFTFDPTLSEITGIEFLQKEEKTEQIIDFYSLLVNQIDKGYHYFEIEQKEQSVEFVPDDKVQEEPEIDDRPDLSQSIDMPDYDELPEAESNDNSDDEEFS